MERIVNDSIGLKAIQLAADTFSVKHPCILSEMKEVKIGEDICIIFPNNTDPLVYPARILDLWQKGDVLYLKLWNYRKDKMEMYLQDLSKDESLFLFVSMPFVSKMSKVFTDISILESRAINKLNRNNHGHSLNVNDTIKDKQELSLPYYDSSGKMVMKYISESEIMLDLPFILTHNKRLKLNMPYLKTENCLSGNKISAIRLLNFDTYDTIIVLSMQDLQSKKTFSLEYNMNCSSGYWIWSLSDFESLVSVSQSSEKN